jgi:hypothetical protein
VGTGINNKKYSSLGLIFLIWYFQRMRIERLQFLTTVPFTLTISYHMRRVPNLESLILNFSQSLLFLAYAWRITECAKNQHIASNRSISKVWKKQN